MSRDASTPDPLSAFEKQLQALRPAASIDRDQLMFRAGQASTKNSERRPWRLLAATNGLSALAAGLLVAMTVRDEPADVQQVADRPAAPPPVLEPREERAASEFAYLALRNRALRGEWREPLALSSADNWENTDAASSYRQLLEQYSQELR